MSKSKILSNPWVVAVLALFCAALWGSATPFIKIGYELILPEKNVPSTILFAGVRFFFAGVITVLIYSIASGKLLYPQKANIGKIAQVSVFQTVLQYIFFYVGLANTSGVKGTILSGTSAFFSLLIASLIFKQEKLTPGKIIGCISGFAGIIFVNLNGLDFTMNFTGDCFVLFSAVALGFSSVLMKKYSKDENPVVISGYQFIMGGIAMVLIGLVFGGKRGKGAGRFNLFIVPLRSGICHLGRAPEKQPGFQGHCLQFYDPRYGRSAFQFAAYGAKRRFRRESGRYACVCVCGNSYFELQKGVTEPEGLILPACAAGGCWGGGKKRARRTENPRGGKFFAASLVL